MVTIHGVEVDPANAGALEAWDGEDGRFWTEQASTFEASMDRYQPPLFDAAAIEPGERVLDVGCGTGQTTREAARQATPGAVLGVDLSARMLEHARRQVEAASIGNAEFVQADAQVHRFEPDRFDLVISQLGSMFFGSPVEAFSNLSGALRPGGRVVLLAWQSIPRNHWVRDFSTALALGRPVPPPPPDAPGAFSFADPERSRSILRAAGFVDIVVEPVERPMWFGHNADDAFEFVRGLGFTEFMLRDLDAEGRAQALAALRTTIDEHDTDEGVLYPSAAWLVRARRP